MDCRCLCIIMKNVRMTVKYLNYKGVILTVITYMRKLITTEFTYLPHHKIVICIKCLNNLKYKN